MTGNFYGFSVDWWSLGICLSEMLSYSIASPKNISAWIRCYLPEDITPAARSLVQSLLQEDPRKRLGSDPELGGEYAIRKHEFFAPLDWGRMERREVRPPFLPEEISGKVLSETKKKSRSF